MRLPAAAALLLHLATPALAECAVDPSAALPRATCSGTDADGFRDGADGLTVSIAFGASVGAPTGAAIRLDGDAATVRNEGAIDTPGDGVRGADGFSLLNAGALQAGGTGVVAGDDAHIGNAALIRSIGGTAVVGGDRVTVFNDVDGRILADRNGIRLGESVQVENRGEILGQRGGVAVRSGRIDNSGAIRAGIGSAAIAVAPSERSLTVVNDGAILGEFGIVVGEGDGAAQLIGNAGSIEGDVAVDLGGGDDVYAVFEGGRTKGDVRLGAGSDILALLGGADIDGDVLFGSGDDTLIFEESARNERGIAPLYDGGTGWDEATFTDVAFADIGVQRISDGVFRFDVPRRQTFFAFADFETFTFAERPFRLTSSGLAPVPLPASAALLLGGLAALAGLRRRA